MAKPKGKKEPVDLGTFEVGSYEDVKKVARLIVAKSEGDEYYKPEISPAEKKGKVKEEVKENAPDYFGSAKARVVKAKKP